MFSESDLRDFSTQCSFKKENFEKIINLLSSNNYQFAKINGTCSTDSISKQYFLGKGGQALVFKGQNKVTKEYVAIKISKADQQIFNDMINETKILQLIICHDHIIKVKQNFLLDEEKICIQILELCRTTLDQEIIKKNNKNEEFTEKEIANIIFSLINALYEIHTQDITHFDIKPQNIFQSEDGRWILGDFGMAQSQNHQLSLRNNHPRCTILYSSPEQFQALQQKYDRIQEQQQLKKESEEDSQEEVQQEQEQEQETITFKNESDVYSLGLTLLQVIGFKLDFSTVRYIQDKNFTEIEKRIKKQFKNFFTFIQYFMLQHEVDNRYSAIRLRQKFLEYFQHILPIEDEFKRIQNILDSLENKRIKLDKYYAYLLYAQSQTNMKTQDSFHIQVAISILEKCSLNNTYDYALFLQQKALIQSNQSNVYSAIVLSQDALLILKKLSGISQLEISYSISLVAKYYQDIGQFSKSLNNYNESLSIGQSLFPGLHPDIAQSIANLSYTYYLLGNYKELLDQSLIALKQRQNLFCGNHPAIAQSLNGVGIAYQMTGKYDLSLEYYLKALEMKQKLYSENNLEVASTLGNIGCVYNLLANYEKSLECQQKALEVRKNCYPDQNHPLLANSYESIGNIYYQLGKFEKSLESHQEVLTIRKAIFNDINHPHIVNTLENIANSLFQLGEINKALEYYQKAAKIYELMLPNTMQMDKSNSSENIGNCYSQLGQFEKAKQKHLKALKIRQSLYSNQNHPQIANSLENIGICYKNLNNFQTSQKYLEEALYLRKKTYSNGKHPEIAQSYYNLSCLHRDFKEYKKAIDYNIQALDIYQLFYKENHPIIVNIYGNMGFDYQNIKDYELAEFYYLQILEINQVLYPKRHPKLIKNLDLIIDLYKCQGKKHKISKYQKLKQ